MDVDANNPIDKSVTEPTELLPSPELVAKIAKLILASTLIAAVVFPFVVPSQQILLYSLGPILFSLIYVSVWYLSVNGRAFAGAWVFIVSTWVGQMGDFDVHTKVDLQFRLGSI